MRVSVIYLFSSLMLCLATATTQAKGSDHVDADAMFDKLVKANHRVLAKLHKSRKRIKMKLHSLGARAKTAAEWRKKWMKEGKTERIERYLSGRADNVKLWYLMGSKANKKRMAKLGLGHIKVGYIGHWNKFNELTDTYNELTKCIIKLRLEQMTRDIADMRARIKAMNDRHEKQMAAVQEVRTKIQSLHTTLDGMINRVATQNLGLEFLLAYLRGVERGLSN